MASIAAKNTPYPKKLYIRLYTSGSFVKSDESVSIWVKVKLQISTAIMMASIRAKYEYSIASFGRMAPHFVSYRNSCRHGNTQR